LCSLPILYGLPFAVIGAFTSALSLWWWTFAGLTTLATFCVLVFFAAQIIKAWRAGTFVVDDVVFALGLFVTLSIQIRVLPQGVQNFMD